MNRLFQMGCGLLLAILVIAVAIAIAGAGGDDTETTNNKDNTSDNNIEQTNDNEGILTAEKFAQIQIGMTYEEVVDIIGTEGTVISESGTKGDPYHTVIYEFETDGRLAAANMTFQDGKLINKSQAGLGNSEVEITLEQFNQLENGMTKDKVFGILGGEGVITSESEDTLMYSYNGTSLSANASLMFQDDKLISKSQLGLE